MALEYIFLNDRLVPAEEAQISVNDRGFLYGDGFFETIRAQNGRILFLAEHLARLEASTRQFLVDNGPPWGSSLAHPYTPLTVWLMRLGIRVIHGRPYHPQTLGKDERFHRTLQAELLHYCQGLELARCQQRFDAWRRFYNLERPHEALDLAVPASRYQESPRSFPETLPAIEYGPGDQVRKVQDGGKISFRNRQYRISKGFRGQYGALRPTSIEGIFEVFFCNQRLAPINLREPQGD
jgi:hypothetical protein